MANPILFSKCRISFQKRFFPVQQYNVHVLPHLYLNTLILFKINTFLGKKVQILNKNLSAKTDIAQLVKGKIMRLLEKLNNESRK